MARKKKNVFSEFEGLDVVVVEDDMPSKKAGRKPKKAKTKEEEVFVSEPAVPEVVLPEPEIVVDVPVEKLDEVDFDVSVFEDVPEVPEVPEVPTDEPDFDMSIFNDVPEENTTDDVIEPEVFTDEQDFDVSIFEDSFENEIPAEESDFDISIFDDVPDESSAEEIVEPEVLIDEPDFDMSIFDDVPEESSTDEIIEPEEEVPTDESDFDMSIFEDSSEPEIPTEEPDLDMSIFEDNPEESFTEEAIEPEDEISTDEPDFDMSIFEDSHEENIIDDVIESEIPTEESDFDISIFEDSPEESLTEDVIEPEVSINEPDFDMLIFEDSPEENISEEIIEPEEEVPTDEPDFDMSIFEDSPEENITDEINESEPEIPTEESDFDMSIFEGSPEKNTTDEIIEPEEEIPTDEPDFDMSIFEDSPEENTTNEIIESEPEVPTDEPDFDMSIFEDSPEENITDEITEPEEEVPTDEPDFDMSIFDNIPEESLTENVIEPEVPTDESDFDMSIFDNIPEPTTTEETTEPELNMSIFDRLSEESTPEETAEIPVIEPDIPLDDAEEETGGKKPKKEKKPRRRKKSEPIYINPEDADAAMLITHGKKKKDRNFLFGLFAFGKIPIRFYIFAVSALAVTALAGITFLIITIFNLSGVVEPIDENRIILDNSVPAPNAFNFIYENLTVPIGDGIMVRRFSFDNHATVVYFQHEFDFTRYDIRLVDDFGRERAIDASFIDFDGRTYFPDRSVWFEPLSLGVRGFTLGFADRQTGDEIEVLFGLEVMHGMVSSTRFERHTSVRRDDGTVIGTIHAAQFSSTGTNLYYTLYDTGDNLRFDQNLSSSLLILRERGRTIHPMLDIRSHTTTAGDVLNRATFHPINFFDGVVDFTFYRVFTALPIGRTVNAAQLFMNREQDNHIIFETGGYRVVLQHIVPHTFDPARTALDSLRLTMYAVDLNAPVPEPDDRSNRREVLVDCRLVITMWDGTVVEMDGVDGRSMDVGADIFFKPGEYTEQILNRQFRSIELVVNEALIRIENITVRVDLDQIVSAGGAFERHVKSHFNRLNADKHRYSVAVVMYERLGSNHRALIRELWYDETGVQHIVTSEIYGFVDEFSFDIETIILHESRGLY